MALHDTMFSFAGLRSKETGSQKEILRVRWLTLLVILQGLSAAFFLWDVILDILVDGWSAHIVSECVATFGLLFGVFFGAKEIWRSYRQFQRTDAALMIASGAFAELVRNKFEAWELTPAEEDVALLTLKGFDGSEIAAMRGTASGTVRAQLGRIYSKSGTNGRGQFVSLFIDALLDAPVLPEEDNVSPA